MNVDGGELRATIETLAAIERPAGSEGEREAANWIADRLRSLGLETRIEEERVHPPPWVALTSLCALGVASGIAALRGRRLAAAVGGALASAGIADDISNGPRVLRGLGGKRSRTWNVVAEAGDPAAERTIVVMGHHDAANTGFIFDQGPQRELHRRFPAVVDAIDTSIPLWWPVMAAPALVAAGALTGRRGMVKTGTVLSLLAGVSLGDIGLRSSVPGANDNLTGVAGVIAIGESLRERPIEGLRVLLVSCGAEESLQEGIRAFASRHFDSLPPDRTWFVNLETVGSPMLALLEGEGPMKMQDFQGEFKELVGRCAERDGIPLRRNLRSRNSTDSVITHRAGYPTATFVSVNAWKALSNYHMPSDVPENVEYDTVADAVRITDAVIRELAAQPAPAPGAAVPA